MPIKDSIAKLFGIRQTVVLDPNSVSEHNMNKYLQLQNAELKGEIAKLQRSVEKVKESKGNADEEEELKFRLNEKKKELEQVKKIDFVSLKHLFNKLRFKKFASNLFYYDINREEKLGRFGDLGFCGDGSFVLLDDQGNLVHAGYNLKDIFQSVKGLGNDLEKGIISLGVDKDGTPIENIMEMDVPEISIIGNRLKYHKARKKPVYDMLMEKNKLISQLHTELGDQEELNSELQLENDNLKRALRVQEKTNEVVLRDVGEMEGSSKSISSAFNTMAKRLEQVSVSNSVLEDNVEKLEKQLGKAMEEAETQGAKTSFSKALETIQDIKRDIVSTEPKVKIVEVPQGNSTNNHQLNADKN